MFWKTVLLFITAFVLFFIISLYICSDEFPSKVHLHSSPVPESWFSRRISQAIHNARLLDFPIPTCKYLNSSYRAADYLKKEATSKERAQPLSVLHRSKTCDIRWPQVATTSRLELDFPLAYFITAYTDARNFELLFSTIFRPHNAVCVHIDSKASQDFRNTVQQILACYRKKFPEAENQVFQSSHSVPVFWGHFSIVEAELICLRDLMDRNISWHYAIDLAGSEQVLWTNLEMVKHLSASPDKIYSDSHEMDGGMLGYRTKHPWHLVDEAQEKFDPDHTWGNTVVTQNNDQDLPPPPYNLTLMKGIKSYRLPRKFVAFVLNHPVAQNFLLWSSQMFIPDETALQTLATISNVSLANGSWIVEQDLQPEQVSHLALFRGWEDRLGLPPSRDWNCSFWRNEVCVWGLEDVPLLFWSGKGIANKFRTAADTEAAECIVEVVGARASREAELSGLT